MTENEREISRRASNPRSEDAGISRDSAARDRLVALEDDEFCRRARRWMPGQQE
jgi:hypothetical protein